MSLSRWSISATLILTLSFPYPVTAADAPDPSPPSTDGDDVLAFINHKNFTIVAKNIQQSKSNETGSQFGIGLDWHYAFGKDFAWPSIDSNSSEDDTIQTTGPITSTLLLSGEGLASLGDPNSPAASNFNSITNQLRYSLNYIYTPPTERCEPPPNDPAEMPAWVARNRMCARKVAQFHAENYTAIDFGAHARTESTQTFSNSQFALGGAISLESGWLANRVLLVPLKYLVPDREESGDVVRSPAIFAGVEQVVGGVEPPVATDDSSSGNDADSMTSSEYGRLRLEVAWTTELLLPGLYPFVNYQLFHSFSGVTPNDKSTAQFVEVGVNYYIADKIDALEGLFNLGKDRGPFLTLRYATGELPPFLDADHQASVGFGFDL